MTHSALPRRHVSHARALPLTSRCRQPIVDTVWRALRAPRAPVAAAAKAVTALPLTERLSALAFDVAAAPLMLPIPSSSGGGGAKPKAAAGKAAKGGGSGGGGGDPTAAAKATRALRAAAATAIAREFDAAVLPALRFGKADRELWHDEPDECVSTPPVFSSLLLFLACPACRDSTPAAGPKVNESVRRHRARRSRALAGTSAARSSSSSTAS